MKTGALKVILWFLVIMLLAFSFPQQVYFKSPLPALLPYLGLALIFLLDFGAAPARAAGIFDGITRKPIEFPIIVYLSLVFFQTAWQTLLNYISVYQGLSAIVVFVFPAAFFLYFRNGFAQRELRVILGSIALAGLIVGGYFAYDSISKLVFHKVPEYNIAVHQYTVERLGNAIGENPSRTSVTSRSMGLLEKHSVSAAWISIGCFAALSLIPPGASLGRVAVMTAYGVPLVLGLNFTGLAGFFLILFLFEFNGYSLARGVQDKRALLKLLYTVCAFIAILSAVSFFLDGGLIQAAQKVFKAQVEVIAGTHISRVSGHGYFTDLLSALASLPGIMAKFPPAVIIGDGFTPGFGVLVKGGDYGFIDTLCRLGVPLSIAVFGGLIRLIRRAYRQIQFSTVTEAANVNALRFAASVMSYVLFSEIHYSIWSSKSILPVIFLCLAIFSCYLSPSGRANSSAG